MIGKKRNPTDLSLGDITYLSDIIATMKSVCRGQSGQLEKRDTPHTHQMTYTHLRPFDARRFLDLPL